MANVNNIQKEFVPNVCSHISKMRPVINYREKNY